MSTKDGFLSLKDNSFVNHNSFTSNNQNSQQFNNLNLNQNSKEVVVVHSHSNSISNKQLDSIVTQNYEENDKLNGFNKSSFNDDASSKALNPLKSEDKEKTTKSLKNNGSSNSNNSTLSLHITAYENSIQANENSESLEGKMKDEKCGLSKTWKATKQNFAESKSDTQIEFPRQQKGDKGNDPEVMQFKASQKLFNPNHSDATIRQERNMPLLPPPPAPPVITLDDDDDERREDGELSDDDGSNEVKTKSNQKSAKKSKKKGKKEDIPDTPAEGSDIEVVGGDLFVIDDEGAADDDEDGIDQTINIDDDEVFKKMKRAAGIHNDDIDISLNISETPKATRGEGTCFNCRGPHTLNECTLPLDRKMINRNRQSFGSTRKDRITERTESKFVPGKLSEEAVNALNLYDEEYPQWIYRMREMGPFQGYPPAYLKRFKPSDKRLAFYCEDPHLTNEVAKVEVEFDPEKLVYYDGFNLVDSNSPAERRCNQGIRKEFWWKKWNKRNYPIEFEKFLKDSINQDKIAEKRKRQHSYDDNQQQHPSKRDKNHKKKEKRREKQAAAKQQERENRAAERKAEIDKRSWQNIKLDEAQERLLNDFNKTNFTQEPQKITMVNDNFGIFASEKERKAMDREKSRSARSLEIEANWINRMQKEEEATAKAKAERERLAKEEKAAKKPSPKSWKERQAEKREEKKAEREERDKQRLKIEKKFVNAETQTDKVIILPCNEDAVVQKAEQRVSELAQQNHLPHGHGNNILSILFPSLPKDVKEESHNINAAPHIVHHSTTEISRPKPNVEIAAANKVVAPQKDAAAEILVVSTVEKTGSPEDVKQTGNDKSITSATAESQERTPEEVEVVDIITVKQVQQEKLLETNVMYQNALKGFPNIQKQPKNDSASSKASKDLEDPSMLPSLQKPFFIPPSDTKKSLINPSVSKQELNNFKNQPLSAKDTVGRQLPKTDDKKQLLETSSKSSMPPKQGKQYVSDPSLPSPKRRKRSSKKTADKQPSANPPASKGDKKPSTSPPGSKEEKKAPINLSSAAKEAKKSSASPLGSKEEKKPLINPPVSKEDLKKFKENQRKAQTSAKDSQPPKDQGKLRAGGNQVAAAGKDAPQQPSKKSDTQQQRLPKNFNAQENRKLNSSVKTFFNAAKQLDNQRHHEQQQSNGNRRNNKKKGQRNDPPPMEDFYGAPITNAEARILSSMSLADTKPKVSAPRKQSEKDRYKNDPQIPAASSSSSKNRGRYESDANFAGPSSSSSSRGNHDRPNTHIIFKDSDTPASPTLPPVVSRAMTEDQAAPKNFLVAVVDDRKMPNTDNFAKDITPFQYDNLAERKGTLDILEALIKSVKKD